ncbi:hypothetical protein TrCOL_g5580 [Triparma columacea]|uniref:Uncharacterized protein n=1 Tax=Triparma columacea TaxID=722753 RepID=A0A9W7G0G5_9STRA|nr:hypothetical protein TrCOL_g5580 [Triparma columacea]
MDNIPCRPPRYLGLRFTPPDASSPLKNRSLTQSPGHLGTSSPHSGESLINVTKEEHEALSAFSRYIPVGVVNKGLVRIVCEEGGGGTKDEGTEASEGGGGVRRAKQNVLVPQSPRKRRALMTLEGEEDVPQLAGKGNERAPQFEVVSRSPQSDEDKEEEATMNGLRSCSEDLAANVSRGLEKSVISKNLEICDSHWSPAESKAVESWPSRLLRLLANDLLDSSIKSSHKVRRQSQILRAMGKIKFVTNVSKAVQRKNMDNGQVQRSMVAAKKELGHLKYLSSKGTDEGVVVVGKSRKQVTLDLGAIGEKIDSSPTAPITCSMVVSDYLTDFNFLYSHSLGNGDSTACPGCGLPLHRHSIAESTMIEESILEEYVRYNREEGKGLFRGTTNAGGRGRRKERGEEGGEEDGKAAKRLKSKFEQLARELRGEVVDHLSGSQRRSLFLRRGESGSSKGMVGADGKSGNSSMVSNGKRDSTVGRKGSTVRKAVEAGKTGRKIGRKSSTEKIVEKGVKVEKRLSGEEIKDATPASSMPSTPSKPPTPYKPSPPPVGSTDPYFSPAKAAFLSSAGSKGVSKKRRRLHDKVVKDRARKLRGNSELRRKVEESKRQREEMKAVRVAKALEVKRREWGALNIQRIWMGMKGRRKARGVFKRVVGDLSVKVVNRLIARAAKNAYRKIWVSREREKVNENVKNDSASKIQQYWAKRAKESKRVGRWSELYQNRKEEKRRKVEKKKEEWSLKMIHKATKELEGLKRAEEIRSDRGLWNECEVGERVGFMEAERKKVEEVRRVEKVEKERRRAERVEIESKLEGIKMAGGGRGGGGWGGIQGMVGAHKRVEKREKEWEDKVDVTMAVVDEVAEAAWVEVNVGKVQVGEGVGSCFMIWERVEREPVGGGVIIVGNRRAASPKGRGKKLGRGGKKKVTGGGKKVTGGGKKAGSLGRKSAGVRNKVDRTTVCIGPVLTVDSEGTLTSHGKKKKNKKGRIIRTVEFYRSEVANVSLSGGLAVATFKPFVVQVEEFAGGDRKQEVRVKVMDWGKVVHDKVGDDIVWEGVGGIRDLLKGGGLKGMVEEEEEEEEEEDVVVSVDEEKKEKGEDLTVSMSQKAVMPMKVNVLGRSSLSYHLPHSQQTRSETCRGRASYLLRKRLESGYPLQGSATSAEDDYNVVGELFEDLRLRVGAWEMEVGVGEGDDSDGGSRSDGDDSYTTIGSGRSTSTGSSGGYL